MNLNFLKALKAPKPQTPLSDPQRIDSMYRHWRWRSLYASFIGYAIFYFCRKNLSAATPGMIADLGYSKTSIGTIWSVMYLAYAFGKFINGILGDRANSRYFMALGLVLSAITNIVFGLSSSLVVLGIAWGLNGWFQSMGGPTCARVLTNWFSPNELGTKWALWNVSHQVGGGIILILGGYLTAAYGWRFAFFIPALIAIACAVFLVNRLRDTPQALGLPEVEDYRKDYALHKKTEALDEAHPVQDLLWHHVLGNRQIWFLAFANFFVYLVRYGAMDWAPTYLVEVKHSSIANAAAKTAAFEFLGIAGSLLAGWAADRYFPTRKSVVNVTYMFVLIFAIAGFWWVPPGYPIMDAVLLGAVGFLVYGPQMLVGVCAADAAGKHAAATANGMTGLMGYMGSIISGVGTGWVVEHYGWSGGFILFIASAIIGMLCFFGTSGSSKKTTTPTPLKIMNTKVGTSHA